METRPNATESPARIVVIDDDCDSLAYLTTLLSRRGVRCERVRAGP